MDYKEIPGFPGYRAGEDGTIQSCWKRRGLGTGKGTTALMTDTWHVLKQRKDRDGYWHVRLNRDRKKYYPMVHSLVLLAFTGKPKRNQQCRHDDGNKDNNHASNLFWGTVLQNNRDRVRHGTIPCGETNTSSKLTEAKVREVVRAMLAGSRIRPLAAGLGVTPTCIQAVLTGKTWTRVTGLPAWPYLRGRMPYSRQRYQHTLRLYAKDVLHEQDRESRLQDPSEVAV